MADFLIYGSCGYAGSLLAGQAIKSRLRPLLAGDFKPGFIMEFEGIERNDG